MNSYRFKMAGDNYAITRNYRYGTLTTGQGVDGRSDVVTFDATPADAVTAVYLLDFGDRVEARFVAGWSGDGQHIFLQPFPLSEGVRPDALPINMSMWMLGPRRAFHLKLREVPIDVLNEHGVSTD